MKTLNAFILILLCGACATSKVSFSESKNVSDKKLISNKEKKESYSTVRVVRDTGMTGHFNDVTMNLNGKKIAEKIRPGESITFYLEPNKNYVLGSEVYNPFGGNLVSEQSLKPEANQALNYRVKILGNGGGAILEPTYEDEMN